MLLDGKFRQLPDEMMEWIPSSMFNKFWNKKMIWKKLCLLFLTIYSKLIFKASELQNYLSHLKFNRHSIKSIFDLLTLNWFSNGFLHWTRGRSKKIHHFFQHLTDPVTHFFIFWLPLFGFWCHFTCIALRQLQFWQTGFLRGTRFFLFISDMPLRL